MISERHKKELVRAYRAGTANRGARYRSPGPITVPVPHRSDPDRHAFREARDPIGDSCYHLRRLPTADEQLDDDDSHDGA